MGRDPDSAKPSSFKRYLCPGLLCSFVLSVALFFSWVTPQFAHTGPANSGALWVATIGQLFKLDPGDGSIDAQPPNTGSILRVAVDDSDGTLWGYGGGTLWAFGSSGNLLVRTSVPHTPDSSSHTALAVDSLTGHVWLAIQKKLYHFNDQGQPVKTLNLPDEAQDLSFDPSTGRLWVATESTVTAHDGVGGVVKTLALPNKAEVNAIAVDRILGSVWVALSSSLRLYSATGMLIQQKTIKDLGRLADDGDHGVWAATGHRLLRLSATGQTLVDRIPLNLVITSLVADRTDQSVWVGGVLLLRHIDENGRTLRTTTLLKVLRDLALFVARPQENRPPVAVNDTAATPPNTAISVQVLANDSDPDGDTLKITAVTQGTNGKVTNTDTMVAYTPAAGFRGTDSFTYTISDGHNHTATATVTVTVNQAPVITSTPPTSVTVGQLYGYDVDATDPGDTLTFALDLAPAGMTINSSSGLIQWTPTASQVGANNVTVRVRDAGGLFATQSFTMQVIATPPANRPPVITTTPPTTGTVGQLYSYDVDATDPDAGNTLTFSLTAAPTGMTINSSSGLIQWAPAAGQVGANNVTVRVQDQGGLFATQSFTVQVSPPASLPPVITSNPPTTATVGRLYSHDVDATDPDAGDTVTYSLNGAPLGMTIDPNTGVISWTPLITQTGAQNVTAIASDGRGGTASQTFSINVNAAQANGAPTAQDDLYAVRRGETLTVAAPGVLQNDSDPDGQSLTSVLVTSPTKGTLNFAADGSFNYTPAVPPPNSTEPVLKFSYSDTALFGGTLTQPIVIDLNKDGIPEIVFISQGPFGTCGLSAVHGNDGSVAFSINGYQPAATPPIVLCGPFTELAAGDIDGDGFPEIIAVDADDGINVPPPNRDIFRRQLIAFNHDGTHKWTSEDILSKAVVGGGLITSTAGMRKPVIADLNGDGIPEIVVGHSGRVASSPGVADEEFVTAFDNLGRILWTVRGGGGSGSDPGGALTVQDIDLDGKPEILFGDDVYDNQGNRLWSAAACLTCLSVRDLAVANLDDDPFAEIVYLDRFGQVYVYEHTGLLKWGPLDVGTADSLLTIGDVDGDGKAEIVVTSGTNIVVIAANGSSTRTIPVPSPGGSPSGGNTTIFDLNGDGKPELIHNGFRSTFDTNVGQGNQQTGALYIFDGATGTLLHSIRAVRGGGIYPEQGPVVADVNGDGSAEIVTGGWNGMPLLHVFEGKNGPWAKARPIYNQVHYNVTNVNSDGTIPAHPAINWLTPGLNNFRVNIPLPQERTGDKDRFTYKANDGSLDSNTATVNIDILPPNHAPQILSQPPTVASPNIEYLYPLFAFDADAGEILTFSLTQAPAGMNINPANGLVRWTPAGNQIGRHVVAVKVTDSQGEFAYQGYTVEVVGAVTVPNVVGQTQGAAQATLTTAGLTLGTVITTASNTVPAGQVISQGTAAGTNVPAGAGVSLVISSGPQTATVPNVVGQSQAAAQSAINGVGLNIGTVTTAPSTTVAAGNIISQDPVGGTAVALGTSVNLIVSMGTISLTGLTSIVVEPATPIILVGQEQAFTATGIYSDGTSQNLTGIVGWSSTAPTVATISTVGVAKGLADGSTTIRASASSITGSAALTVRSRIADGTLPNAAITAPTNNAEVTSPVDVVGNATDANFLKYRLEYAPAGETTFTLLNESTTPVSNGVLGKFDPTMLINDQYTIRLTVFDRGGNTQHSSVNVQVARDMKVGNFSLTFTDLNVPMSGLPIVVNRVYDSRDKRKGDFGIGWRLAVQTMRIRTNRVLGTGWVRNQAGAVITLTPTDAHKVSVTLPNGRVEEFDMQVSPTSGLGGLDFTNVTGFTPRAGTVGKLEALAENSLAILNAGALDELVEFGTLNTYNPQLYRYTSLDGTEFVVHRTNGVQSIKELNGNTLTFGPNGIIHSAGKSALFQRDSEGRIIQLTDPRGNIQSYTYDVNGDLISHTDQLANITRFSYNHHHDLLQIMDPLNRQAVRNEYDANGRLIATTDATGGRVTFSHNVAAQEELITNTRGFVRRVIYDAQGNVTFDERAVTIDGTLLNATTTSTYDTLGNETSRVDPDGLRTASTYNGILPLSEVVDANGLNLTTSFAYNPSNDVSSVIDPGGRTFSFSYDGKRNITQVNSPVTGPLTSQVNAQGLPTRVQDALGNVTSYTRDSFGNITREEVFDPTAVLLQRKDFSYDVNGNKVSETLQRTSNGVSTSLTTLFAYDAKNRLVAITDPAGGSIRIEYDTAGNETARIDPLGRRTSFTYDDLGRRTRTTFPDGTFETTSYDSEGNVISQNDRAARTTTFEYDQLNRRVKTNLPDGTLTRTIYSAGGRVAATVDAKGNRTDYAYDTAGRRTATTLPAVQNGLSGTLVRPQTSTVLNSLGTPTALFDANGRQTSYQYNSAGRPVRVTFADGTFIQQQFDALGRRTSITNEEGQTTTFIYDGLGRLKTVSGLAGDAIYTYDEAGNLLTQTDALGRVTHFRYDAVNRQIEKQYPAGEVERLTYDLVGNVTSVTNTNGQAISFEYDSANRMTRKNLPGGSVVTFSYTATGQRAAITDARGTTSFTYDVLDRLASITHPTGQTVTYARDVNGNLANLTTPSAVVSYSYDALDRLISVTAPEGQNQSAYDLAGNKLSVSAANGLITDYTYDPRNRPTQLTHRTVGGTVLQSFANVFSPAGRRTQVTEADGSVEQYGYDARGRLIAENRTGASPFVTTHSYDAVGNRTQTVNNGTATTFTYDTNDRLLNDGTATYTYDANGNLTRQTAGSVITQYGYDAENRLTSVVDATGTTQFAYDADGNRVQSTSPAGTTQFLVDTENNTGLSQVLEERDGAGTLQARYTYGDDRLAMVRGGNTRVYHSDAHGSTRLLTDGGGAITDTYNYDGYGRTLSATGTTANSYRYSGERLDSNSGLYHLRARYYNPVLARFMSRDPFGGRLESPVTLHRYLYADSDPVNNSDPTGQITLPEISIVQAINTGIDTAFSFGNAIVQGCNLKQRLDVVGQTVLWGSLSASALSAASLAGLPGKTAFSVIGYNPVALGRRGIKQVELRVEVPFALKLSLKYRDDYTFEVSLGKDVVVGAGPGISLHKFELCGLEVGEVTLKSRVKGGILSQSVNLSFAVELAALKTFRLEYPIYEATLSVRSGNLKFFGF